MKKWMVFVSLFLALGAQAQFDWPGEKVNIGFGLGVDYGGLGGRVTFLPKKNFGLLAGLGYNFAGAGFNAGGVFRIAPDRRVVPCLYAMYGYNAVLRITGAMDVKKIYYGPSAGFGLEIKSKRNKGVHTNIELLLPARPAAFQTDINQYRSMGVVISDPLPVSISIGYHIGL